MLHIYINKTNILNIPFEPIQINVYNLIGKKETNIDDIFDTFNKTFFVSLTLILLLVALAEFLMYN